MRGFAAFRFAVAVFAMVPLIAGAAGMALGSAFPGFEASGSADLDSHMRYLSGLLFGIGLGFWLYALRPEKLRILFPTLAAIVILGGLARFASLILVGAPSAGHIFALFMELGVTPFMLVLHQYFVDLDYPDLPVRHRHGTAVERRRAGGQQGHLSHTPTGQH